MQTDKERAMPEVSPTRPPRDNLVRAEVGGYELRSVADAAMPTLAGHFSVVNTWTEIDSVYEGRFMEKFAPGAWTKTMTENRDRIKVTFNHGHDPSLGDKVLGPIEALSEDAVGAAYEVPLLDTSYNRDLLPGLEAGLYGSSMRFTVMRDDVVNKPERSEHNPDALPERTITEAKLYEFGPVTYPAYADATAGIRSLTDEFIFGEFTGHPERLINLIDYVRSEGEKKQTATKTPPPSDAGVSHLAAEKSAPPKFRSREEFLQWMSQN